MMNEFDLAYWSPSSYLRNDIAIIVRLFDFSNVITMKNFMHYHCRKPTQVVFVFRLWILWQCYWILLLWRLDDDWRQAHICTHIM